MTETTDRIESHWFAISLTTHGPDFEIGTRIGSGCMFAARTRTLSGPGPFVSESVAAWGH